MIPYRQHCAKIGIGLGGIDAVMHQMSVGRDDDRLQRSFEPRRPANVAVDGNVGGKTAERMKGDCRSGDADHQDGNPVGRSG